MTAKLLIFPTARIRHHRKTQLAEDLNADPNYRFIRDLLIAIEGAGLSLDTSPEAKARDVYRKYRIVQGGEGTEPVPGLDAWQ